MSLRDSLAQIAGRVVVEADRFRERVDGQPPRQARGAAVPAAVQSVDQLMSILAEGRQQVGLQRTLSDQEAKQHLDGWQYASIDTIASAVMMAEREVQVVEAGAWVAAADHPLERLLSHVNPIMTGAELTWWTITEMLAIGKSYWRIADNALAEPAELWPIVGRMEPIGDPTGQSLMTGWKETMYDKGVRTITHELRDIVYLRLPKLGSILGGYGRAQAAGAAIRMDLQIDESEWAVFKQGIWPTALVFMDEPDAKKRDALMTEFREKYASPLKHGSAIGLAKGRMDVTWPPTKPREMGYPQGADRTRDKIAAIIRTPLALLGMQKDVNRASAEAMEYIFAKWGAGPVVRLFQERVNQDLAQARYEDTRVVYKHVVPADKEYERAKRQTDVQLGIKTINEARAEDGLEPVPWGDVPILPIGWAPLGEGGGDGEEQRQGDKGTRGQGDRIPGHQVARSPSRPVALGYSRAKRAGISKRAATHQAKLQGKLQKTFAGFFREIKGEVLAAYDETRQSQAAGRRVRLVDVPKRIEEILEPGPLAERIAKRAAPVNRFGLVLGGDFEKALTSHPEEYPWGEGVEAMERYMAQFRAEHYQSVADTTRARYMDTVKKGIEAGDTWDEMRLRIVETFGAMESERVATIAETETTKLYGAGGQAFRDQYEIASKQWVTSFVNSRDTHAAADGQIVANDEEFHVGGDAMMFPGDGSLAEENCNCHCVSVGIP